MSRRGLAVGLALTAATLIGSGDLGRGDERGPWSVGAALPIAVTGGRANFEVPADVAGRVLVVVAPLTDGAGPYPIRLSAMATDRARPPVLADDGPIAAPAAIPEVPAEPTRSVPLATPPARRNFDLLTRDGDPLSAANYSKVAARLRAVGRSVQVYVDEHDVGRVADDVLRDVVATFDDRVEPEAARRFGRARDVDGDGRFTVLMTGWLARLAGGRIAADGFVRGADLDPGLAPPLGNRCDMMYLNAGLRSGPHLRTVLAHEYTHAITFSRKLLDGRHDDRSGGEEEGWLDEGLAHLVEDLHGFSRSNLDYRVDAFLADPAAYRLRVRDYYADDLFRSHGNRGSTYLFLDWCADRFGPGLLPTLIGSQRRGPANLEAATGQTFERLFRRWSASVYWSGLNLGGADAAECGAPDSTGPRPTTITAGGPADAWSATGTAPHYTIVRGASGRSVAVEVTGPAEARLQVTAIPLPDDLPEPTLEIRSEPSRPDEWALRPVVREQAGRSARLLALSWTPLVPPPDPRAIGPRRGRLEGPELAALLGGADLPANAERVGRPLTLNGVGPADGPLVFTLTTADDRGRRAVAWAIVGRGADQGRTGVSSR